MMQTMTHIGAGFEKNFNQVPCVAIGAKHGNACGVGVDEKNELEAVDKMLVGDLRAIFGGSVMLNFPVNEKIAEELIHKFTAEGVRRLLDVVAAPSFTPEAIEILSRKKGKCRLLVNPAILKAGLSSLDSEKRFRYVRGGFLTQPNYTFVPELKNEEMVLAWAIGCTSNSNTITLVKDGRLYGNGVGQQDRVGAAKLAILRADDAAVLNNLVVGAPLGAPTTKSADLENATAYSDSFFPFPDAVEVLINRGIKNIFSTSGSVNDEKIIELCKSKGVNLVLMPDAEARGFYQH
jgi:phosphoribosylaminoimidazolecarboxamide formyltransferase/IMP cyclohydrolase